MKGTNNKTKIIVLIVVFILFTAGMFFFGYGIMANKNQVIADTIAQRNVELEVLLREQKSFEQGKIDLAILEKSQYPPDELFSSDTKVVKEIQQLESAAQRYGLDIQISVSGSVSLAKPVTGVSSELFAIPYTITLTGSSDNVLLFVQAIERMPFITHTNDLSITVNEEDQTTAVIFSEFYIKK